MMLSTWKINNWSVKKKQYLCAGLAGAGALGLVGLVIWSVEDTPQRHNMPSRETKIATAGQRINPQEVWVERLESEHKINQQKLDALEKAMFANIKTAGDAEERSLRLEQEMDELRAQKNEGMREASQAREAMTAPAHTLQQFPGFGEVSTSEGNIAPPPENAIRKIVLNLTGFDATGKAGAVVSLQSQKVAEKAPDKSTLENTLPAGTFVKAVLLGGVDASTAVAAASDPRPVLLRLTDKGTLPRHFKSDLKNCHILASCYGDLSSERVYMRLEKLTCTEPLTGEISETQVAGYVVGEDGKAGVRGVVADKAGPLIRNSLIGGFFSGIGKFFETQHQPLAFPAVPGGAASSLYPRQLLTAGAANGASHALEKYADFFIKRAEQLQPVLQVAAGREVDIVVTQGTRFGDTSVRSTIAKIRDKSRQQAVEELETTTDSQSWLPPLPQGENTL